MKMLMLSAAAALSMITPAVAAEIELKIATDSGTADAPSGLAIAKWAERIEEGSNGEIDVKVFYQDELGTQLEVFDLFVAGEVDLMLSWPSTSYDKRIGVVNTPYMVSSWSEANEAFGTDGWANEIYNEVFNGIGLKYLGAWPEGFAGVATRGKYASNIEDARDLKVRVQPFFPIPNTMKALGYQTEALEWGEVFTSIQTGIVDGDSGNVIFWDYEYFGELLDYYVHTRHDFVSGNILANAEMFDGLSDAHKQLILDTSAQMMNERFASARAEDEANIARAVEGGMEYIEPTAEEVAAMKAAVRETVWPLMEDQIGADIMEKIRAKAN